MSHLQRLSRFVGEQELTSFLYSPGFFCFCHMPEPCFFESNGLRCVRFISNVSFVSGRVIIRRWPQLFSWLIRSTCSQIIGSGLFCFLPFLWIRRLRPG